MDGATERERVTDLRRAVFWANHGKGGTYVSMIEAAGFEITTGRARDMREPLEYWCWADGRLYGIIQEFYGEAFLFAWTPEARSLRWRELIWRLRHPFAVRIRATPREAAMCDCGHDADRHENVNEAGARLGGGDTICLDCSCIDFQAAEPLQDDGERELGDEEVEALILKMLDYSLLADPEDSERNRVIACDLIRTLRSFEHPQQDVEKALAELVRLYELKLCDPAAYARLEPEKRAAWVTAKAVIARSSASREPSERGSLGEVLR